MTARKAAAINHFEEAKDEENVFNFKPERVVQMPAGLSTGAVAEVEFDGQQALFYSGMVYSTLDRAENPSLELDKLDLADIIVQIQ